METFRSNEDITTAYHRHEQCRYHGYQVAVFVTVGYGLAVRLLVKPYGACPESESSERLVGPCKITPDDVKIDKHHAENAEEERQGDDEALGDGALVPLEEIGYDESSRTERCVATGDRCGNDTDVYKAVEGLKVGDTIDLEGFLYWYNGANPHITGVTVK